MKKFTDNGIIKESQADSLKSFLNMEDTNITLENLNKVLPLLKTIFDEIVNKKQKFVVLEEGFRDKNNEGIAVSFFKKDEALLTRLASKYITLLKATDELSRDLTPEQRNDIDQKLKEFKEKTTKEQFEILFNESAKSIGELKEFFDKNIKKYLIALFGIAMMALSILILILAVTVGSPDLAELAMIIFMGSIAIFSSRGAPENKKGSLPLGKGIM